MKLKNQFLITILIATFVLSFLQFAIFVDNKSQKPSNNTAQAAQSTNLDTNITSYIGSNGEEAGEATGIGLDNTFWYGGAIADLSVNYNKTPINILGGGIGTLLHFDKDGKTLKNIIRLPSAVKDIAMDKTQNRLVAIGDFGLVYIDTTNYNLIWNKILPIDSGAHPDNFKIGSRVDIGTNGNIASLYGKRITVWNQAGTNLTGSGNATFGISSKIITDIAIVDANNTVVVIGETQKDGGPCSQWRAGWMKAYTHTGTEVWKNYDWTQYEVSGTISPNLTNYCADAMPKRITLGADNNLYMVAESAGGNSIFQADPRDLTKTTTSLGKNAGGDNFNNTSNMGSQHISFMMKYAPTTGILSKQQVWVARLPAGTNPSGGGANTILPKDIAVSEDGIIGFVGRSAAYFPDRNIQTQTLNGTTIPAYDGNGDGFYLEILPDMRTRARSVSFKKTLEQEIKSVAVKGSKRVIAGEIKNAGAQVPTMNPIQSNNAGGITEGIVSAWGFEDITKDYAITATKSPTNPTQTLGSSFATTYNYSYTGTTSPQDTTLKMTLFQGLIYPNELFDGFACTGTNPKICTKTITASQWQSGGNKTLDMSIQSDPAIFNNKTSKEILFQLYPTPTSVSDVDVYPFNNIATVPIILDLSVANTQDYVLTPTLMTTAPIALGGFAEVKLNYTYSGPVRVTDKRITFVVPTGMEYDPLNRSSMSPAPCSLIGGLETCSRSVTLDVTTNSYSETIYFKIKNPASRSTAKNIAFNLVNTDSSALSDNNNTNHTNKIVTVNTTNTVAISDYGVSFEPFGYLSDNTIPVSGSKTIPLNLQYTGNTPPVRHKLTVNIPTGLSYEYITNNGFVCVPGTNGQVCTTMITSAQWSTSGLSIPINVKADSSFVNPAGRTITASVTDTKNNAVDITPANNTTQTTLNLTNTQPTSSANSSTQVSSVTNSSNISSTIVSSVVSSAKPVSSTQASSVVSSQVSSQNQISSNVSSTQNSSVISSQVASSINSSKISSPVSSVQASSLKSSLQNSSAVSSAQNSSTITQNSSLYSSLYSSQIPNSNNCYLLSLHPFASPPSISFVQKMEQWQTKKNAVILLYAASIDNDLPYIMDNLNAIWNNGNVPLLSLEFYAEDGINADIETRIANGYKDNYFGLLNQRLKVFLDGPDGIANTSDDRRVYIRPAHEANGNWYPWSGNTADYITSWRRMYGIVNANMTKNQMQWIWNVNNTDATQLTAEQYYPGDQYVDWLGVDGYNWGTSKSWSTPQTPSQVFGNMVQRLRNISPNKPISINEVATTTAGSNTAGKNLWIKQMFEYTATNNIKMLSWFNEDKETDWGIYGGSGGNEINQGYKAYSQYRIEATKPNVIGSNPTNSRYITDSQFAGNTMCDNPTNSSQASSNNSSQVSSLAQSSANSSTQVSSLTQSSATNYQVRIDNIAIVGTNYQINFTPTGYTPTVGGMHTHFYYDTEANTVMNKMVSQPSPYILAQSTKPAMATKLCSIVSNPDHSIIPNSGNCVDLPTNQTSSANSSTQVSSQNQVSSLGNISSVPSSCVLVNCILSIWRNRSIW